MNYKNLFNEQLMETDFAEHERKVYLCSIPPVTSVRPAYLANGQSARGIWMTDVSATDRRSVKAQLARQGDWRTSWWGINCFLHGLLKPGLSPEQRMYSFHVRHHRCTLFYHQSIEQYGRILKALKCDGLLAGLCCAIDQAKGSMKEQP